MTYPHLDPSEQRKELRSFLITQFQAPLLIVVIHPVLSPVEVFLMIQFQALRYITIMQQDQGLTGNSLLDSIHSAVPTVISLIHLIVLQGLTPLTMLAVGLHNASFHSMRLIRLALALSEGARLQDAVQMHGVLLARHSRSKPFSLHLDVGCKSSPDTSASIVVHNLPGQRECHSEYRPDNVYGRQADWAARSRGTRWTRYGGWEFWPWHIHILLFHRNNVA